MKKFAAGAVYVLGLVLVGFVAGGFLGGRVFGGGGMGWDQIADALGGAFLGIVAGLVVAGFTVSRLAVRQRLLLGLAAIAASSLIVWIMRTFPPAPVGVVQSALAVSLLCAPQEPPCGSRLVHGP